MHMQRKASICHGDGAIYVAIYVMGDESSLNGNVRPQWCARSTDGGKTAGSGMEPIEPIVTENEVIWKLLYNSVEDVSMSSILRTTLPEVLTRS